MADDVVFAGWGTTLFSIHRFALFLLFSWPTSESYNHLLPGDCSLSTKHSESKQCDVLRLKIADVTSFLQSRARAILLALRDLHLLLLVNCTTARTWGLSHAYSSYIAGLSLLLFRSMGPTMYHALWWIMSTLGNLQCCDAATWWEWIEHVTWYRLTAGQRICSCLDMDLVLMLIFIFSTLHKKQPDDAPQHNSTWQARSLQYIAPVRWICRADSKRNGMKTCFRIFLKQP